MSLPAAQLTLDNRMPNPRFADYLELEQDAAIRSEYVAGNIYAMTGASETHNTIATSFSALLETQAAEHCRVWQADMKVTLNHDGDDFAYYPDIMAACEPDPNPHPYIRTNPCLIVEVLSHSTQRTDMQEKLKNYLTIPSLLEYVVVSQTTPFLMVFRKKNHWQREPYYAEDELHLDSLDISFVVQHIYRRVRKEVGLEVGYLNQDKPESSSS